MNTKLIAAVVVSSFLSSSAEGAIVVSNLANQSNGTAPLLAEPDAPPFPGPFTDYQRRAQSFMTGTNLLQLGLVTLSMEAAPGGGGFHVDLHNDAAGVPSETPLTALAGDDNPNRPGNFQYVSPSLLTLLPNTTYWVVASAELVPPVLRTEFSLTVTQDPTETGEPGWSLGNSFFRREVLGNVDSGWFDAESGVLKISVSAVPESTCISLSLVTSCSSGGGVFSSARAS